MAAVYRGDDVFYISALYSGVSLCQTLGVGTYQLFFGDIFRDFGLAALEPLAGWMDVFRDCPNSIRWGFDIASRGLIMRFGIF